MTPLQHVRFRDIVSSVLCQTTLCMLHGVMGQERARGGGGGTPHSHFFQRIPHYFTKCAMIFSALQSFYCISVHINYSFKAKIQPRFCIASVSSRRRLSLLCLELHAWFSPAWVAFH